MAAGFWALSTSPPDLTDQVLQPPRPRVVAEHPTQCQDRPHRGHGNDDQAAPLKQGNGAGGTGGGASQPGQPSTHGRPPSRLRACCRAGPVEQPGLVAGDTELCGMAIELHKGIVTSAFLQVKALKTTTVAWQDLVLGRHTSRMWMDDIERLDG